MFRVGILLEVFGQSVGFWHIKLDVNILCIVEVETMAIWIFDRASLGAVPHHTTHHVVALKLTPWKESFVTSFPEQHFLAVLSLLFHEVGGPRHC